VRPYDQRRIEAGRKRAANSTVVITGLARDIESRLRENIKRAEYIGAAFGAYRIVVFENDSDDGTREIVKEAHRRNELVEAVECCDEGSCECKLNELPAVMTRRRIDKMTAYRNKTLTHIQKHYNHYDYVLVLDLDAEGPCALEGIFHSLSYEGDWDMIASNGQMPMPSTLGQVTNTYDALAHSTDVNDKNATETPILHTSKLLRMIVHIRQYSDDMVPVYSAFNGAALYKMRSLDGARYENYDYCEHIGLHKNMRALGHGRMYVNRFWKWYVGFQGPRSFAKLF
jgi:hypothetical protein